VRFKQTVENSMNMKNLLKYSTVAGAVMALAGSAFAVPTLTISDGLDSITLSSAVLTGTGTFTDIASSYTQNGGNISFDGTVGGWTLDVTVAAGNPPGSTPPGGTAAHPIIDLNSGNDSFTGSGGTLTIKYTDDNSVGGGLGPTIGSILTGAGGTQSSGWKQTIVTYVNGSQVGTGSSSTSPWGVSYSSPINQPVQGYSLGIAEVITASGTGSWSGDNSLSTVPDGGLTVALLGSALTGVALLRRKLGC
jgi:VPDSG-CTERM motif